MKTLFALTCLLVLSSNYYLTFAENQVINDSITVTFILETEPLPEDSSVYITGSLDQLGNWDPDSIRMEHSSEIKWIKKILLDKPSSIEYKYTLGSWSREGIQPDGQPLQNFVVNISSDTTINNKVSYWSNQSERIIRGQITGTVQYHYSLWGEGVTDRNIIVWLPPDYGKDTSIRYPVLYMHDGQNIIDPYTSAFGIDWEIDESADSLIKEEIIPPFIIVGIYNTPDRSAEYIPGDKGTQYMNFVINRLKPFIDSAYYTLTDKEYTFTGGSSAGGTISFMLLWEHSDVFSGAICMSPAFKIGSINLVDRVNTYVTNKKRINLYIDVGGIGIETRLEPGIIEMVTTLKKNGYKEGEDFLFIKDPESHHFESAWAKRIPEALKFVFRRLKNPD